MIVDRHTARIEKLPSRLRNAAADGDDRVVLRLSRESLRAEPPAVRFVERLAGAPGQQRLPWSA
jgi:hypothetical protein